MENQFRVRPAGGGDVAALVALVNSAYRGESSRAGWSTEADLIGGIRVDVERVDAAITGDGHVVLVHESEEGIVGSVQLEMTTWVGDSGVAAAVSKSGQTLRFLARLTAIFNR